MANELCVDNQGAYIYNNNNNNTIYIYKCM